jgi:hypothetical protein
MGSAFSWVAAALQTRVQGEEIGVAADVPPDEEDKHDGEA